MRVVADTNIVVSGLFWKGPPRSVLDAAAAGDIELFTTPALLAELEDVLDRERFQSRLTAAKTNAHELTVGYAALATVTTPAPIEPVVPEDPDDDAVLACAIAGRAKYVVSGDSHLLALRRYASIEILSATEFLTILRAADTRESHRG